MRLVLRVLLFALGFFLSALALMTVISGGEASFGFVAQSFGIDGGDLSGFSNGFIDGTVRFLSFILLIFGIVLMNAARDYEGQRRLVPIYMLILILAGCARLWSVYQLGTSSTISLIAAMMEILPAVLILLLYAIGGGRER